MCGIFCFCGLIYTESQLERPAKQIKHRGPDDYQSPAKTNGDDPVIFGFHRLKINGLDAGSNQPLKLGDNLTLICNGEIYNHQQLEKKYGFTTHSHSDCEVILHMYQQFGIAQTLRELIGVYAFVLYDAELGKVYAARDPIGIRPMFYGSTCSQSAFLDDTRARVGIAFGSEAKCIYPLLDADTVEQFPPGHYLVLDRDGFNSETMDLDFINYFDLDLPEEISSELSDADVHANIRKLIIESTAIRCNMSDRKVGVFLSGGLDSSLLAAIAIKYIHDLHSFAIGLEGSPDLKYSRVAAEAIGTKHTEVHFTVEEALHYLPDLVWHLETPDVTTIRASMPMYLLSKYIKEKTNITVILSGEGPDEVFSGYLYNHNAPSSEALHNEAVWRVEELHKYDVLRGDRTTSAWSLEVRVPLLDINIIRYAFTLDPKLRDPKYNKNIEKYLIRKSFEGYLPDSILWRPKEAFSDGVGYDWVAGIKEHAEKTVTEAEWASRAESYPVMTPETKEGLLYRQLYETHYKRTPSVGPLIKYIWLPKWSDHGGDPSATALDIHKTTVKKEN